MSGKSLTAFGALHPLNDVDSQLAVELACEISPLKDVLSRHGITKEQLRIKLQNQHFRKMVGEAKRVWQSDLSIKERIRVKGAVLVEDALIELYKIFTDNSNTVPARLDAFKSMARVADVFDPQKQATIGEKVTISFNFGDSTPPITVEGETLPIDEGEAA